MAPVDSNWFGLKWGMSNDHKEIAHISMKEAPRPQPAATKECYGTTSRTARQYHSPMFLIFFQENNFAKVSRSFGRSKEGGGSASVEGFWFACVIVVFSNQGVF